MKLNEEAKNELRQIILEKLENVPEGERIHIDKEILDSLIFETFEDKSEDIGDEIHKEFIKIPVWTGEFLSKIDLSEISFKNVCLYNSGFFLYNAKENLFRKFQAYILETLSEEENENLLRYSVPDDIIIFKNTNAIINLDELFDPGAIECCDLSGTKLTGTLKYPYDSNLENCGLTAQNFSEDITAEHTNFTGNNLKGLNLTVPMILGDEYCISNFSNTGATLTTETLKDVCDAKKEHDEYWGEKMPLSLFDYFAGCVTENGKVISSREDIETKKEEIRREYETLKQEIFDKVSSSIDEQIAKKSK